MKIETQTLEDNQVKMIVEIEPAEMESAMHRAARKISQQTKIPGFRPGKAPYNVVLRFAGEEYVSDKAVELLVDETYPKALDEAKVEPYGPGELKDIPSRDPLKFEFIVPLEPEVTLGDYRAIRLDYEEQIVSDEEVERTINSLRERQVVVEPVERPAQVGDQVSIKLSAQRKQVNEGESAVLLPERPQLITVAEGTTSEEWPFPGFSSHLLGLSVGDSKTVSYTFPEDSPFEALRGKEADYIFVIEAVKSRHLPELNDEFAQSQGEYETVDALQKAVRDSLEAQKKGDYDSGYTEKIVDVLLQEAVIKFPPQMLDHEIDHLVDDLKNRLARQKMELETYLKTRQMDDAALREELKPSAEKRLRETLALLQVGKAENIKIGRDEIETEANRTITQLGSYMNPQDARKIFTDEFMQHMFNDITTDLLFKKTVARLHALAKGETIEADESEAPVEAETLVPTEEAASASDAESTTGETDPEQPVAE